MAAITHTAMFKHLAPIGTRVRQNAADECANERFIIRPSEPETASRLARAPALRNRPVTTEQRSCFMNPATCNRARPPGTPWHSSLPLDRRPSAGRRASHRDHPVHLPFETARLPRFLLALAGSAALALRCLGRQLRCRLLPASMAVESRDTWPMSCVAQRLFNQRPRASSPEDGTARTRQTPVKTSPRSGSPRHATSRTVFAASGPP